MSTDSPTRSAAALTWQDEDVNERLRRLEAVTDSALSRLSADALVPEVLERVRELLGADTVAILLLDDSGQFLVADAARGIEEEVRQGTRVPVGLGFAGRIAAERHPVILDRVDHTTVVNPLLIRKGISSMLGVPLLRNNSIIGVLHVGTLAERVFSSDDAKLLELAADRVAAALGGRRAMLDQIAASTLQRSLFPRLPHLPDLAAAARYVPGSQHGVGGDWYDMFPLPSGEIGIAIGDVMGHGLDAATVMGRLRAALRAYAIDEDDPARVLERLDRQLQHFEPEQLVTVLYGVLDPDGGTVRLSRAGHLAPVLAAPTHPAKQLSLPHDIPLGVRVATTRHTTVVDLPRQGLLTLFTDGLVESRIGDMDDAVARLCDTVAEFATSSVETICAELMSALVGERHTDDDVSLLVIKRGPSGRTTD